MYIVSVLLGEQLSQSFGPCHARQRPRHRAGEARVAVIFSEVPLPAAFSPLSSCKRKLTVAVTKLAQEDRIRPGALALMGAKVGLQTSGQT